MALEVERMPAHASRVRPRVAARAWRVAVAALLLWPFVAWGAARVLVVRAEVERADALVVLSGSAAYRERADEAARLYREGRRSCC